MYLVKAFGDRYSLSQIDEMKVKDIRELLKKRFAIGPRVNIEGHEAWYDKGEFDEPIETILKPDDKEAKEALEILEDKMKQIDLEQILTLK